MTSRTGGQPVDTVVPLHSHALQVAQHFSVGWFSPIQFIEKRGGIALSLVRPLRAIDKTTRLSIAFHRRAGSASPRKKLAWNCRVVSTSPQRIEATDSTLFGLSPRGSMLSYPPSYDQGPNTTRAARFPAKTLQCKMGSLPATRTCGISPEGVADPKNVVGHASRRA